MSDGPHVHKGLIGRERDCEWNAAASISIVGEPGVLLSVQDHGRANIWFLGHTECLQLINGLLASWQASHEANDAQR